MTTGIAGLAWLITLMKKIYERYKEYAIQNSIHPQFIQSDTGLYKKWCFLLKMCLLVQAPTGLKFRAASPTCFPYTTACQLTQPVVGYTVRDMALELGLQSGTGKLIPLLLDAGTSRCTRISRQQMGNSFYYTPGPQSILVWRMMYMTKLYEIVY